MNMHIYHKYTAGDIKGALEPQYKLNPVRLAMDVASFPVAAKDMAQMRGRKVRAPLPTNKLTGPGKAFDKMHLIYRNIETTFLSVQCCFDI